MSNWTEADIPALDGKIALVTGANSGLGLATARALASKGARVILACRGQAKADAAAAQIRETVPGAQLETLTLDLSDLASIREAAATLKSRHDGLDLLINNAGVMGMPLTRTRDGFEMLFGTNHLGHFAFNGLIFDLLRHRPGARIVTVASIAHRSGKLPMDDLNWERRRYSKSAAYGQSKLANLVYALELDRRLRAANLDVQSVAAHPGYAATNIVFSGGAESSSLMRRIWNRMAALGNLLIAQPAELGALPTLYVATEPEVRGGDYFGPNGPIEFRGYPAPARISHLARDPRLGRELWAASEKLTGVHWDV